MGNTKKKTVDPTLPLTLRIKVREVLAALPGDRKIPKGRLADAIEGLGYEFKEEELDEAIEWNHKRNLIDYNFNHKWERDEWFVTDKGRNF